MRGEWKIIAGATLFALIPVGVKLGDGAGIYSVLIGRLLVATLVVFLFTKDKRALLRLKRKEALQLTFWSVLMLAAMLCYFQSIRTGGIAVSSALLGAQPVLILLFGNLLLKEKMGWWSVCCALLTVVGIVLVNDPRDFLSNGDWSKLLALSSAGLLALIFIYQKKYLMHVSSQKLVFYQCLLQLPFLLPLVLIEKPLLNGALLSSAVLLGTVCTAAAYFLIYSGVKTVKTGKIGVLQSVEYVLPVFIGMIFYQEALRQGIIVGCTLILAACVLVNVDAKKSLLPWRKAEV